MLRETSFQAHALSSPLMSKEETAETLRAIHSARVLTEPILAAQAYPFSSWVSSSGSHSRDSMHSTLSKFPQSTVHAAQVVNRLEAFRRNAAFYSRTGRAHKMGFFLFGPPAVARPVLWLRWQITCIMMSMTWTSAPWGATPACAASLRKLATRLWSWWRTLTLLSCRTGGLLPLPQLKVSYLTC